MTPSFRPVVLTLCVLCVVPSGRAAQPAEQAAGDPVRITSLDTGFFRFTQGRTQSVIDLRPGISGCWGPLYDGATGRKAGGNVAARVLDLVRRAGFWYVVMQVNTAANCNVQGRCGAGTNSDVLWLKLSPQLRVAARQGALVSACDPDTQLTRFRGRLAEGDAPALELAGGVLALEYKRTDYGARTTTTSTLRYEHTAPQRGLTVRVGPDVPQP